MLTNFTKRVEDIEPFVQGMYKVPGDGASLEKRIVISVPVTHISLDEWGGCSQYPGTMEIINYQFYGHRG
jgi:hypothetical protein